MCFLSRVRYQVFMLHSSVQTLDQKKVLETPPSGIRKIASIRGLSDAAVICFAFAFTVTIVLVVLLVFFFIADSFY